jgi:hypothetical protein
MVDLQPSWMAVEAERREHTFAIPHFRKHAGKPGSSISTKTSTGSPRFAFVEERNQSRTETPSWRNSFFNSKMHRPSSKASLLRLPLGVSTTTLRRRLSTANGFKATGFANVPFDICLHFAHPFSFTQSNEMPRGSRKSSLNNPSCGRGIQMQLGLIPANTESAARLL